MPITSSSYRAIFSSDWSECLSPSGPFDFIAYNYPRLQGELDRVFRHYTSNRITLSAAVWQIRRLLTKPVTEVQMDAYLRPRPGSIPIAASLRQGRREGQRDRGELV